MSPELIELRRMTVVHQAEGECDRCDKRWIEIRDAANEYALRAVRAYAETNAAPRKRSLTNRIGVR